MRWHLDDIPLLLNRLPHALHDLLHHEDKALVTHAIRTMASPPVASGTNHSLTLALDPERTAPAISLEKTLDPLALRSAQNVGLLLHDYIRQLPGADLPGEEGEKLLAHWRDLMLDHPERLSTAHLSHWHEERCKMFLQDLLEHKYGKDGIPPGALDAAWEDWQRASGIGHGIGWHDAQHSKMQQRQWRDLVTRTRLHYMTYSANLGHTPSGAPF